MTPHVDEKLTRQVAHLARLELTDDEVRTYSSQLGRILEYVQSLQAVDVSGVVPLISPADEADGEGTLLREDDREPSCEGILDCAPDTLDHGFKVPPIL